MRRSHSSSSGERACPASSARRLLARRMVLSLAWITGACMGAGSAGAPLTAAPPDWNVREVAWMPYEAGLAAGKSARKPIVLVLYTDWCPHCHNYSRLFHDPELVRLSHQFVMVRVERDAHREISAVYDIDGEYVPRTFMLTPSGAVLTDLASDNDDFRYFLEEHDPAELIALMQRALARVGAPSSAPTSPSAD